MISRLSYDSCSRRGAYRACPGGLLRDEHGLTTVSMVVSLLVSISLLFSVAQVYRLNSVASRVQDVADAAALAAENQVADFVLAARLCDAVVLSLSLTSLVSYGLGVVALCVPGGQGIGDGLLEVGGEVSRACDEFSDKATQSLGALQKMLPYLCAVRSAGVAVANGGKDTGSRYSGVGIVVPSVGERIVCEKLDDSDIEEGLADKSDALKEQAAKADEAAKAAQESKQRAFERDCGDYPSYCMYERAEKLAGLSAADNPLYTSVDAWSFSVALERAKAYYRARAENEAPAGDSVEEGARSALRLRFYEYASSQLDRAFVRETADSFEAFFPRMPRNTEQVRASSLYTDAVYPANESGGLVAHAWSGCPQAQGSTLLVSLEQIDQDDRPVCPACQFSVSSMGLVAAASTSVDNGFEYHYAAVVDAAEEYQRAKADLRPLLQEAKVTAGGLLSLIKEAIGEAGANRIEVSPPGSMGVISFAVDTGNMRDARGFDAFVGAGGSFGPRAAVSAATLIAEKSEDGRNAISSLLDRYKSPGIAAGAAGIALDCWARLLNSYSDGQSALCSAVEGALDAIPLAGASGLGLWAAKTFEGFVDDVGLAPAKTESLKPVLVNTGHVADKSEGGTAKRYLEVKKRAVANPSTSVTDLFSSILDDAESAFEEKISGLDSLEIAEIELIEGGAVVRVEVPLPPAAKGIASAFVEQVFTRLRSLRVTLWGGGMWE